MTDIEWFRALFTIALILWALAGVLFAQKYATTLLETGFKHPFVWSAVWLAASNTAEVLLYTYVVWFEPNNRSLSRNVAFIIPCALITQALAYMVVSYWVMRGVMTNGHVSSSPD